MTSVGVVVDRAEGWNGDVLDAEDPRRDPVCVAGAQDTGSNREARLLELEQEPRAAAAPAHNVDSSGAPRLLPRPRWPEDAQTQGVRQRVAVDDGADAESRLDIRGGEHLVGWPLRDYAPAAQEHEPMAVARGQAQIVDGGDRGHPLAHQVTHQLQYLELVVDVQVGRRLVQEQDTRLLRERPRHEHSLALAARERCHFSLGEPLGLRELHCLKGDAAVGGSLHLEPAHVGVAAHHHHLQAGEPVGISGRLGHLREDRGDLLGGHLREVPPLQRDLPRIGLEEAGDRAQQGGFPGAVRSDQADELAPPRAQIDPVQDACSRHLVHQVASLEGRPGRPHAQPTVAVRLGHACPLR